MKRRYLLLGIALLLLLLLFLASVNVRYYSPFKLVGDKCANYYQNCTCIGQLLVMESYPPQYSCQGWNSCKDISITKCK